MERNIDEINKSYMKKPEIIKEIADTTGLKQTVVKSVLDSFEALFIRECLMTGSFTYPGIINIRTRKLPSRKAYHIKSGNMIMRPEMYYLKPSLPKALRAMNKFKERHIHNEMNGTNADNWYEQYIIDEE